MGTPSWNAILLRIATQDAHDIDDLIAQDDPGGSASIGSDVFPRINAVLMPQAPMKRTDAVAVGIRVGPNLKDAADRAMRLTAFAIERDVDIVVLAEGDTSGLERFGFRHERIVGEAADARSACEDQIRRFWNIDLVL
jgi:hypothetical protein